MNSESMNLLARLSGVSTPRGLMQASQSNQGDGAVDGFASLLNLAKAGQVSSDRLVEPGRDVQVSLTQQQQGRLAAAVDQAQSAGLSRALVLMDGKALVVDVTARTIESQLTDESGVLDGVDGVISVPPVTWASAAGATGETETLAGSHSLLARLAAAGASVLTGA